jgi:hypothetical protein
MGFPEHEAPAAIFGKVHAGNTARLTAVCTWRWGGSSTQALMPTYVSILRIPQMISVWRDAVEGYIDRGKTEELRENLSQCLFPIFMLCLCPAFWHLDTNIHLVFSGFTSRPTSLLASNRASKAISWAIFAYNMPMCAFVLRFQEICCQNVDKLIIFWLANPPNYCILIIGLIYTASLTLFECLQKYKFWDIIGDFTYLLWRRKAYIISHCCFSLVFYSFIITEGKTKHGRIW